MSAQIDKLLAAALALHKGGRLAEAEQAYRRILVLSPGHADTLHFLGIAAFQQGRHEEAVSFIARAIAAADAVPAYHNNLGNAYKALGRLEAAEAAYRAALGRKADYAEAQFNLGITLQAQGRPGEALDVLRRALALRPRHPETHFAIGNVQQDRGACEEALAAYGRALDLRPNFVAALVNRGNVLLILGREQEALEAYGRAVRFAPAHAPAHHNLGLALLRLGRPAEAAAECRRAVELDGAYIQAHCTLAHALRESDESEEAEDAYRRALALDPDCAEARLGLALATLPLIAARPAEREQALARFRQAITDLAQWCRAHPGRLGRWIGSLLPFHLPYGHGDVTAALREYGDLASAEAAADLQPPARCASATLHGRGRVRLLLVSGQVRRHPVWDVITRGIVAHLDRSRFELVILHTAAAADGEAAWARAHADRFVQGPLPRARWLELIAAERPDVILYPEVGMDPAVGALAPLRLAPLQVAAWGHPVTTGLPSIDLFLSGELFEPADAGRHYRERLVCLPGTGVCTEPPPEEAQPWGGPARTAGVVRFALCQQPIKFDPADDALLARIASLAAPCELWLATPANLPGVSARLRERLATALRGVGLDPEAHLRPMGWLSRGRFCGFLEEMDIYLDCPAFSGYTTAWQALRHGLPVLTLEGPFLRQRLAAGLLRQIGATEGLVRSTEDYVRTAAAWAQEARHPQIWRARRAALRAAARRADDKRATVAALERCLLEELAGRN